MNILMYSIHKRFFFFVMDIIHKLLFMYIEHLNIIKQLTNSGFLCVFVISFPLFCF